MVRVSSARCLRTFVPATYRYRLPGNAPAGALAHASKRRVSTSIDGLDHESPFTDVTYCVPACSNNIHN